MSFIFTLIHQHCRQLAFTLGLLVLLTSVPVHASDSIGKAVRAVQAITLGKGLLTPGDEIYLGDELAVGRYGTLTIQFHDDSTLILTPESRAKIVPIGKQKHRGNRMPTFVVRLNGKYRWMTKSALTQGSVEHIDDTDIFTAPTNEYEIVAKEALRLQSEPEPVAETTESIVEEEPTSTDEGKADATTSSPQATPETKPARDVKKQPAVVTQPKAAPAVKPSPPVTPKPAPAANPVVTSTPKPAREEAPKATPKQVKTPQPTTTPKSTPAPARAAVDSKPAPATTRKVEPPAEVQAKPASEERDAPQPSASTPQSAESTKAQKPAEPAPQVEKVDDTAAPKPQGETAPAPEVSADKPSTDGGEAAAPETPSPAGEEENGAPAASDQPAATDTPPANQ